MLLDREVRHCHLFLVLRVNRQDSPRQVLPSLVTYGWNVTTRPFGVNFNSLSVNEEFEMAGAISGYTHDIGKLIEMFSDSTEFG